MSSEMSILQVKSWTIKKAECQRIDAFERWCWRTLERPFNCKKVKSVNPKINQSWIFIGRPDAEAEAPIFWPPDVMSWLIRKDSDAGKDWRREVTGMAEDGKVGWHHRLNGHESEQSPGNGEGQRSLAFCSCWITTSWTLLSDWTTIIVLTVSSDVNMGEKKPKTTPKPHRYNNQVS